MIIARPTGRSNRALVRGAVGLWLALVASCTSTGNGKDQPGGSGGVAITGTGGGGAPGSGGTVGSGGAPVDASTSDGAATLPFTCNQINGLLLTSEWYQAGFETGVVDARWQLKWQEHSYIDEWANLQSTFWNAPVVSQCAAGSDAPDRVVLEVLSWTITAEAEWEADITSAIDNLKIKYPNLRRVDLLTVIRGPHNMLCPTAPAAGETIQMPPALDAAMLAAAAKFPGFAFVGPKFEAPDCAAFAGGGPHLTAAGNRAMATLISAYFATTP